MKTFVMLFIFLFSYVFAFENVVDKQESLCPAPKNLHVVTQTSNAVTYDWDDCSCSLAVYRVYYVTGGETSDVFETNNSTITFTNLAAGTYRFNFYTTCTGLTESIIVEDMVDF